MPNLDAAKFSSGEFVILISSIECSCGFKKKDVTLFFRDRSMFCSPGYDYHLPWFDPEAFLCARLVTILHLESAVDHHEQLIFFFVMMPGERAFELNELYLLIIKFTRDAWIPVIVDES